MQTKLNGVLHMVVGITLLLIGMACVLRETLGPPLYPNKASLAEMNTVSQSRFQRLTAA